MNLMGVYGAFIGEKPFLWNSIGQYIAYDAVAPPPPEEGQSSDHDGQTGTVIAAHAMLARVRKERLNRRGR